MNRNKKTFVAVLVCAMAVTVVSYGISFTKTYTSKIYGISFSYPKEFVVTEHDYEHGPSAVHEIVLMQAVAAAEAELHAQTGFPSEGPPSIGITLYPNPGGQSVEEWVRTSPDSNYAADEGLAITSTTIDGMPALSYHSDRGLYASDYVTFSHKGLIIVVTSAIELKEQAALVTKSINLK